MKKRLISLLVLTLVMALAPAAMANHCLRCKPLAETCVGSINYGFQYCDWDDWTGICVTSDPCGNHSASLSQPLAAEYAVASVERIDEPQANPAAETLVASAAAPAPATR